MLLQCTSKLWWAGPCASEPLLHAAISAPSPPLHLRVAHSGFPELLATMPLAGDSFEHTEWQQSQAWANWTQAAVCPRSLWQESVSLVEGGHPLAEHIHCPPPSQDLILAKLGQAGLSRSICFPSQPPRALVLLLMLSRPPPNLPPWRPSFSSTTATFFFFSGKQGFSQLLEGSAQTLRWPLATTRLAEHSRRVSKSTQVGSAGGASAGGQPPIYPAGRVPSIPGPL